jgi:hypothetical protein
VYIFMLVNQVGLVALSKPTKRTKNKSQGSFALETENETEVATASEAKSVTGTQNFFALQEISEEEFSRKQLMKRSKHLLNLLDNYRKELLLGHISINSLKNMRDSLRSINTDNNTPQIVAIMQQIEIRLAVELAKAGKYNNDNI